MCVRDEPVPLLFDSFNTASELVTGFFRDASVTNVSSATPHDGYARGRTRSISPKQPKSD